MELLTNQLLDGFMNLCRLEIAASAYARLGREWQGEKVCASFSKLYFVESGSGWLRCGENTVMLEPGKLYWIPPGVWVDFGCEEQLSKLYFHIQLLKPDRYDLLQGVGKIASAPIPEGWLEELLALQTDATITSALIRNQYLYRTVALLLPQFGLEGEKITTYSENIRKCIAYVHANLRADLRVSELAGLCFVSTRYLTELFVRELGVTPGRYIDDQLILEAQRRLSHSGESVAGISEALGVSDPFYFSRKFKNKCGITPLQYRKKTRT